MVGAGAWTRSRPASGRGRAGRTAAVVAILLLLAACSSGAADESAAAGTAPAGDAGTLRMGLISEDIESLDPHFATTSSDRQIVGRIFNGLVRFKPDDFTAPLEPDLAVEVPEPTINDDGTQTWTFELREDVQCHAGPESEAYELTAEDVVYSYEKSRDTERSAFAGDYAGWESVEAVDEHTVAITLAEPRSEGLFLPQVANYAGGFVVCKQAVEAMGDDAFKSHPVGTGSFVMGEYRPADGVTVTANDAYWRGRPKLDAVDFRFLPDDTTRDLALVGGEVDLIMGLPEGQWLDRMNAEEGVTATGFPIAGMTMISLRMDQPPFDDQLVREAFFHAIDRTAHAAVGGEDVVTPVSSIVNVPGAPGGLDETTVAAEGLDRPYDPERARALLAEAGHADDISFEVVTSPVAVYRENYEILQSELAAVGITMTIASVDHPTMHTQIREGTNATTVYNAPRPTMDILLTQFVHGHSIVVGGEAPVTNFSFYDNPEVNGWLDEARAETDAKAQAELWERVNRQVLKDAAVVPLYVDANTFAYRDTLTVEPEPVAVVDNSWPIDETTTLAP